MRRAAERRSGSRRTRASLHPAPEAERRLVSVLFADLVGLHDPLGDSRRRRGPRAAPRATSTMPGRSSAGTAGPSRSSSATRSWPSGARPSPWRTTRSGPFEPRSSSSRTSPRSGSEVGASDLQPARRRGHRRGGRDRRRGGSGHGGGGSRQHGLPGTSGCGARDGPRRGRDAPDAEAAIVYEDAGPRAEGEGRAAPPFTAGAVIAGRRGEGRFRVSRRRSSAARPSCGSSRSCFMPRPTRARRASSR